MPAASVRTAFAAAPQRRTQSTFSSPACRRVSARSLAGRDAYARRRPRPALSASCSALSILPPRMWARRNEAKRSGFSGLAGFSVSMCMRGKRADREMRTENCGAIPEEVQHDPVVGGLVHFLDQAAVEGELGEDEVDLFPVQGPPPGRVTAHGSSSAVPPPGGILRVVIASRTPVSPPGAGGTSEVTLEGLQTTFAAFSRG